MHIHYSTKAQKGQGLQKRILRMIQSCGGCSVSRSPQRWDDQEGGRRPTSSEDSRVSGSRRPVAATRQFIVVGQPTRREAKGRLGREDSRASGSRRPVAATRQFLVVGQPTTREAEGRLAARTLLYRSCVAATRHYCRDGADHEGGRRPTSSEDTAVPQLRSRGAAIYCRDGADFRRAVPLRLRRFPP